MPTLGYENDPENYAKIYPYSIESIKSTVCPLPEKVFPTSRQARDRLLILLKTAIANAPEYSGSKNIVRQFVTTSSAFIRRKLEYSLDNNGNMVDKLSFYISNISMPHFVWVMEVSTQTDYKNRRIFGEVILDATANKKERNMIYLRIGNSIYFNGKKSADESSPKKFNQYTHNLGEI